MRFANLIFHSSAYGLQELFCHFPSHSDIAVRVTVKVQNWLVWLLFKIYVTSASTNMSQNHFLIHFILITSATLDIAKGEKTISGVGFDLFQEVVSFWEFKQDSNHMQYVT
jgi:hypothetical protein